MRSNYCTGNDGLAQVRGARRQKAPAGSLPPQNSVGCEVAVRGRLGAQKAGEGLAGVRLFGARDLFRGALGDDPAAALSAFGAKVDDPVGLLDDVEMVLDDEHGVAQIDEALQDVEEFADVVEMQAGGGFVEDVHGAAGLAFRKFAGKFDALGFAAGQRGGGLTELHVAEAHFDDGGELLLDVGNVFEEFEGVAGREVQDIIDAVALVANGQRFRVVAATATDLAGDINVRQK